MSNDNSKNERRGEQKERYEEGKEWQEEQEELHDDRDKLPGPKLLVTAALALVLLLILILVLTSLFAPSQPELSVTCTGDVRTGRSQTTSFLSDRQVILIGPSSGIEATVAQLIGEDPVLGKTLSPIRSCNLGYLGRLSSPRRLKGQPLFPSSALDELVIYLYPIPEQWTISEALTRLNRAGEEHGVYADLNYLTGLLGQSQCSNPYEPVGSPYEPVGSPYEPVGSGVGESGAAAAELFWSQWVFEHIGAGLALDERLAATGLDPTGAGIHTLILDTAPFEPPFGEAEEGEFALEQEYAVEWWYQEEPTGTLAAADLTQASWQTETWSLTVAFPQMLDFEAANSPEITPVAEHGLFVAGLVRAVAPDSDIRLVRVLDDYGCGDLFGLVEVINRYVAQMVSESGTLDGVVFNLSMGIHKPTPEDNAKATADQGQAEDQEQADAALEAADAASQAQAEDSLETLQTALYAAYSQGAVIVAAAGNESDKGRPLPPQIPARYPYVIGVSGSNVYRDLSCFSNWGDVSAPAGDFRGDDPTLLADGVCAAGPQQCEQGPCESAVISLSNRPDSQFGYWRGTSFAAPLVSGLAALVLEAGQEGGSFSPGPPTWVFDAIRCGTSTTDGVIDVPATLERCVPPPP